MCLAVPGKILSLKNNNAEVDFSGVRRQVSLDLVPGAKKNDYVLVHAGFAIQIIDQEFAAETLEMLRSMGIKTAEELTAELEGDPSADGVPAP